MASKAHRVAKGLAGGWAILLGVIITGCAAPQYTYVANSGENTYFKVPSGWRQVSPAALKTAAGNSAKGGWTVAYEAGDKPTASDFLSFGATKPFVFAEVATLNSTTSNEMSYDLLRDSVLPVTSTARQSAAAQAGQAGYPLTGFTPLRDQVLTPGQGVHGVRETYDYTYADGITDTFDEIALTNADQTVVYLLVLHCTNSCYSHDQTEINDVMSSFTVRSP